MYEFEISVSESSAEAFHDMVSFYYHVVRKKVLSNGNVQFVVYFFSTDSKVVDENKRNVRKMKVEAEG